MTGDYEERHRGMLKDLLLLQVVQPKDIVRSASTRSVSLFQSLNKQALTRLNGGHLALHVKR